MFLPKEEPARLLTVILYIATGAVTVYVFFKYLFAVIMPFALGLLLALALRPAMRLIRFRTKLSCRVISAVLVSICGAFAFFLMYMVTSRFYKEGQEFAEKISAGLSESRILSDMRDIPLVSGVISAAESTGIDILKALGSFFEEKMPSLISGVAELVPNVIFFIAAFVFSAVYFLSDYDEIRTFFRKKLSGGAFSKIGFVKRKTVSAICAFLKGYFLIMLLTFAELFVGFLILGVNYAFLIASLTAVIDILPILGVGIVLLPWALYEFSVGNLTLAAGLCVLFVVISAVRQFAEPAILGKKVGIHPLLSMFSMYLGFKLFGIAGMLFFPFLSSLIKEITADSIKR